MSETATTPDQELLELLQENFALKADRDGTSYGEEKKRYVIVLRGNNDRMKKQIPAPYPIHQTA